jgi:CDP-diacylglycerol---glycerol-3-phosphate 3-phosphatidyltransferase
MAVRLASRPGRSARCPKVALRVFEWNIPNGLTLFRILLVPVLVAALLSTSPGGDLVAAAIFALASFTDALDGYIARRQRNVTAFGKLMDPLADKLLITGALVALVSLDRVQAWVAMVIIAREFAVTGLRLLAVEQGQVIPASIWGKLKTAIQVAMVFALILVTGSPPWLDALVYGTVLVTVLSGLDYFVGLRRLLSDAPPPQTRPSSQSRMET